MSTSEGEKHPEPEAEPTPTEAAAEPVVDAGTEQFAPEIVTEATTLEPIAEEPPVEATPEEPEEKRPGFFTRLVQDTSPYTMLLWIALAALIAGTAFLVIELRSYDWDVKAKNLRRSAAATLRYELPSNPTAIV